MSVGPTVIVGVAVEQGVVGARHKRAHRDAVFARSHVADGTRWSAGRATVHAQALQVVTVATPHVNLLSGMAFESHAQVQVAHIEFGRCKHMPFAVYGVDPRLHLNATVHIRSLAIEENQGVCGNPVGRGHNAVVAAIELITHGYRGVVAAPRVDLSVNAPVHGGQMGVANGVGGRKGLVQIQVIGPFIAGRCHNDGTGEFAHFIKNVSQSSRSVVRTVVIAQAQVDDAGTVDRLRITGYVPHGIGNGFIGEALAGNFAQHQLSAGCHATVAVHLTAGSDTGCVGSM